jgi:serpin B
MGVAASLGACSLGQDGGDNNAQMLGGQTGDEFDQIVQRIQGTEPRLAADGASAALAADELAEFGWTFYAQAGNADANFVYSPYSLATAAAMLYAGAAGTTQSEMSDVFAFSEEGDAFHQARNDLLQILASRNVEATESRNAQHLKISNDFWMESRLQPTDHFLNVLSAYYGAPVFLFEGSPEDVRVAINGKVSDDTVGLIPELLPPLSITADTIFVLTNALYFKANWSWQFDKELTAPADFETAAGTIASVDMMHIQGGEGFRYAELDGTQVLAMPYFGSELEFVALVPPTGTFATFRDGLNAQSVQTLLSDLPSAALNLAFPKMDVAYTLPLKIELIAAGMTSAFKGGVADFSQLATNQLWIGEAFHQAKIILDEEGTEAAAATAFVGVDESVGPTPIDVTIDRAFVFFIRDVQTGALLFLGHYLGPS